MPGPDFPEDLPPPPELPPEPPIPLEDLSTTDRGDEAAGAGGKLPGRPPDWDAFEREQQRLREKDEVNGPEGQEDDWHTLDYDVIQFEREP